MTLRSAVIAAGPPMAARPERKIARPPRPAGAKTNANGTDATAPSPSPITTGQVLQSPSPRLGETAATESLACSAQRAGTPKSRANFARAAMDWSSESLIANGLKGLSISAAINMPRHIASGSLL